MPSLPTVQVGTGNETKTVSPVLLVGLTAAGVLVPIKVTNDGKIKTV